MSKPKKLYDFSMTWAILVILAYLCVIGILAGTAAGLANPLPNLVIIVVLIISFLVIFWYFVGNALVLEQDKIRQGKRAFAKSDVICTVIYVQRYRETVIRFEDKKRRGIKDKHGKPYVFSVQATKRNIAKTEAWLGSPLEIPEKPAAFGKRGA